MLNNATIEIVEESWAKVAALGADKVGVLLFKNIFTIAPDAIHLFAVSRMKRTCTRARSLRRTASRS